MKNGFGVALLLGALLGAPLAASAAYIPVAPGDFTGSRSTPDTSGIVAADGWTEVNGGFKVAWAITQVGSSYHYKYTISNADNSVPTAPDVSHWLLEVSNPFLAADIRNTDGFDLLAATTYKPTDPGKSNPNLPGEIYAVKLTPQASGAEIDGVYEFDSTRAPMWGDFYTKDGKHNDISATAWNTGFGTDPTDTTTDFKPWIAVPDTRTNHIPEPATLLLLGLGLAGFGAAARRRGRKT